ncbi:MAG: ribonuclease Y [Candidatus Liptonbacteria bacterium]|nr:ribonuclease Y [Candidatus Liptonbacteria bacterium]
MEYGLWGPLLGALVVGACIGYVVRRAWASQQAARAEGKTKAILGGAEERAKKIVLDAEHKAAGLLAEVRKEERERKTESHELEERLRRREELLDKKLASLGSDEAALRAKGEALEKREGDLKGLLKEAETRLERVGGLSAADARDELFRKVAEDRKADMVQLIQKVEKENRDEVEKKAMEVITIALQRFSRSHVSEVTTTVFPLGDEDIKGKIIGREGRNIRALERATGVEFVIDETPDSVIISSFDPYRREVARLALAKLIKDGRIQPAKIEEKVEEAKQELAKRMQEIGQAAADEVGVFDLPKEIVQLVGRLHFRTSYGQNVLTHSIEMAHLATMMAGELGLNVEVAKKGALLHDIGKALDHEIEGTHVDLGMKILRKYSIDERVIQAMQSHHEDYPYAIPEAYVVTAADVLSAARPGARRGTIEAYIKRLGDLERIALEFPGVKSAYAISAGRELRIFVIPEKVDDFRALELAREIANKVQSELKYPGEIKVNVIREMRAVEYAR